YLYKYFKHYYGDIFEKDNSLFPLTLNIDYKISGNTIQVKTDYLNQVSTVDIEIEDLDFLYLPVLEIDRVNKNMQEITILLAFLLLDVNPKSSLEIISRNIAKYEGDLITP